MKDSSSSSTFTFQTFTNTPMKEDENLLKSHYHVTFWRAGEHETPDRMKPFTCCWTVCGWCCCLEPVKLLTCKLKIPFSLNSWSVTSHDSNIGIVEFNENFPRVWAKKKKKQEAITLHKKNTFCFTCIFEGFPPMNQLRLHKLYSINFLSLRTRICSFHCPSRSVPLTLNNGGKTLVIKPQLKAHRADVYTNIDKTFLVRTRNLKQKFVYTYGQKMKFYFFKNP